MDICPIDDNFIGKLNSFIDRYGLFILAVVHVNTSEEVCRNRLVIRARPEDFVELNSESIKLETGCVTKVPLHFPKSLLSRWARQICSWKEISSVKHVPAPQHCQPIFFTII